MLALWHLENQQRRPVFAARDDQLLDLAAKEEMPARVLVEAVLFPDTRGKGVVPDALLAALGRRLGIERRPAAALLHGATAERKCLVDDTAPDLITGDADGREIEGDGGEQRKDDHRVNVATTSKCAVWGNRSSGAARTSRYPACARILPSRARVGASQLT